jgi:hypothetical protein
MTSMAFIFGVLPLVLSTGAGAASRHEIGAGDAIRIPYLFFDCLSGYRCPAALEPVRSAAFATTESKTTESTAPRINVSANLRRRLRRIEMLITDHPYRLGWSDDRSFGCVPISENPQSILAKVHRCTIWKVFAAPVGYSLLAGQILCPLVIGAR